MQDDFSKGAEHEAGSILGGCSRSNVASSEMPKASIKRPRKFMRYLGTVAIRVRKTHSQCFTGLATLDSIRRLKGAPTPLSLDIQLMHCRPL